MAIDCKTIIDALSNNPLIGEHVRAMVSDTPLVLQSARQVLAEKLSFALGVALGDVTMPNENATDADRAALSLEIINAVPYLWKSEQWEIAALSDIPRHEISEHQLPFPLCWFTFDRGFEPFRDMNKGTPIECMKSIDALMLLEYKKSLMMFIFGVDHTLQGRCVYQTFPIAGLIFPDELQEEARLPIGRLLSCLSFLRSPHIEKREEGLNRSARRSLGDALPSISSEDSKRVRFLSLQRHMAGSKAAAKNQHIEWSHQWLVCGHHRNQYYPSTQEHKLIWVSPYIKGPEDKPLKPRAYKVSKG
jgi:hypothetical protein